MKRVAVVSAILISIMLSGCDLWTPVAGLAEATAPADPVAPIALSTPAPLEASAPTRVPAVPTAAPTVAPSPTPGDPVRLTASYPISGDTVVPADRPLILEFDRALDRPSLEAGLVISPTVAGTLEWASDSSVAFRPTNGWTEPLYEVSLAAVRAADGAALAGSASLQFGTGGRGIPVPALMYHHVADLPAEASESQRNWTVSPAAFAEQMHYLEREGWHSVTPAQFAAYAAEGSPLPPKAVMITIDDGARDVYMNACPVLMETSLRAVLFVIPSHMEYGGYISWEMARELAAQGMAFGVHTLNHIALRGEPRDVLQQEIGESKRIVEEELGQKVDSFCYPFGSYDENTISLLQEYGYTTAFTLNGLPYQPGDDPFRLNRLLVRYETTLEEFIDLLP